MKRVAFRVRATPPSAAFPNGVPEQMVEADYADHELALMNALTRRVTDRNCNPDERAQAINEVTILHEFKAIFPGSRVLTEAEEVEQGFREPPESAEKIAQESASEQSSLFAATG